MAEARTVEHKKELVHSENENRNNAIYSNAEL